MGKSIHYPQRKRLRLPDHDYSSPGAYFVTICTENRRCVFGEIIDDEIQHSTIGVIAAELMSKVIASCSGVTVDESVVMPNHIHAILIIDAITTDSTVHLGQIVSKYKGEVTRRVRQTGYVQFRWQRGYYDRVIRDEYELKKVREYIVNNPARWREDSNYQA